MRQLHLEYLKGKGKVEFEDLGRRIAYERVRSEYGEVPRWSVFEWREEKKEWEFLGTVSDDYVPVRTEQVLEVLKERAGTEVEVRQDYMTRRHRFTVITFPEWGTEEKVNPEEQLFDLVGREAFEYDGGPERSRVEPMLCVMNSYNGFTPFTFDGGFYRGVCSNGMRSGEVLQEHKALHVIGNVREVEKKIQVFSRDFMNLVEALMNPSLTMNTKEIEELAKGVGMGKKAYETYVKPVVEKVKALQVWVAVQLFTYMFTHLKAYQNYLQRQNRAYQLLYQAIRSKVS